MFTSSQCYNIDRSQEAADNFRLVKEWDNCVEAKGRSLNIFQTMFSLQCYDFDLSQVAVDRFRFVVRTD